MEFAAKIDLIVVDSHLSTRELLARELSKDPRYQVLGGAGTGSEAIQICRETRPDLVILDLFVSGMGGAELIRTLRRDAPHTRFLLYTGVRSKDLISDVLRERPHGLVRKQDSLATCLEGVRVVAAGGRFFSESVGTSFSPPPPRDKRSALTLRERSVLQLVATGLRSKEIACQLGISLKTTEHHRANLMDKLGIHDVATLTCYAIRRGYVDAGV